MVRISVYMCICLLLICFALPTFAQQPAATAANAVVPTLVKFSGTLTNVEGKPLTNIVGVTFSLYRDSQGGAALWMETQNVQPDKTGHYFVMLGSTTSQGLPANVFANGEARWLGVKAQEQTEQPRVLLMSVPYALKALDAETVGGKPVSAFQLVSPQSKNGSGAGSAPAEQANEIRCASGIACKKTSIPVFASNGGSATVTDSIMGQSGNKINVAGSVNALGGGGNLTASHNVSAGGNVSAANVSASSNVAGATGSFSGNSASTDLSVTNVGAGDGIDISTVSGNGVSVTSGPFGFRAAVATDAIVANGGFDAGYFLGDTSATAIGAGVYSENDTDNGFSVATYSYEFGPNNANVGLWGYAASPVGDGVYGEDVSQSTLFTSEPAGVWATSTSSFATFSSSDQKWGISAVTADSTNSGFYGAGFFDNISTNAADTVLEAVGFGVGGLCTINTAGHLACNGVQSVVVPVDNGARKVALYTVGAPESWFEDVGSGRLSSGEAVIHLESTFGQTVNTGTDYHVFLTPGGDCKGLYVAQKSPTSFVVRELGGGTSSIAFDYRIMAKRRGYENVRLADKTASFRLPDTPTGERGPARAHVKLPSPQEIRDGQKSQLRRAAQLSKGPARAN